MYWISLQPSESDLGQIQSRRDNIHKQVNSSAYSIEETPHITILPGFSVQSTTLAEIREALPKSKLPFTVEFEEYHIYPSVENPMVISLEPASTAILDSIQDVAQTHIKEYGDMEYSPKPFHMTLMKGGDAGDEASFSLSSKAEQTVTQIVNTDEGLPMTISFDNLAVREWES